MAHSGLFHTLCCAVLVIHCVLATSSEGPDVGYPVGVLPECPGSTKPAKLKTESLKKCLSISVMGPGPVLYANWTRYKYHEIEMLAQHPDIDFNKKTFLYVGGYLDSITLPIGRSYGEVYKQMGYNTLILDYVSFSANDFPISARLIRPVGKHAAEMLVKLTKLGLNPKKLELVGLSLGGQTMSFIAKHYRQLTGRNISTLVGLDPAGPCFRHRGPEERLDPSDADFVVDIITNTEGFGMATPLGHVTFYVNGGEHQVGHDLGRPCSLICSHAKVIFIWQAALRFPSSFIGVQCDSIQQARDADCYDRKPMVTNVLGVHTDRSKPGIYYLPTFGNYPYAVGKRGLKKENRNAVRRVKSLSELKLLS